MREHLTSFPLRLHRHAASPRGVARAGEIWRLCQEVAVQDAIRVGWPPSRFAEERVAFVVTRMVVAHRREILYGDALTARTWVRDFRRGLLTRRQVELFDEGGTLAEATQEWVHVNASLRPARATAALTSAFPPAELPFPMATLPAFEPANGPVHRLDLEVWHTWMDPLGHVNHPVYVDWADEGTSRVLLAAGLDPVALVPVAEEVQFKRPANAGDAVRVETRLVGRTATGDAVLDHWIGAPEGEAFATARTVRRLAEGGELATALADQS